MDFKRKPPPFNEMGKPHPPLDLERMFEEERIDLQSILDSRKLTKEINKTLAPYTGEFGDAQKKHLLKRTMVGYASRHLKDLEGLTMDEAVDLIMTPHEIGEPINNYYHQFSAEEYKETYGNNDVAPGEPFISKPCIRVEGKQDELSGNERKAAIESWLHSSIYNQTTTICWKLFLFLHNLTPVVETGPYKYRYAYIRLIFEGSYRNYRDFIFDLTVDPSMLEYLNLRMSRKETPDENYAREVQELFTVGKRPFSKYTEGDVAAAARILVGWGQDDGRLLFGEGWKPQPVFDPWNHDTSDKQFSEFYGNKFIQGREGEEGAEELHEFLDMLFETDEVSIYLARRLFQFFVYPILTNYVEENIILPLANDLKNNDYNLAKTLKKLLKSEYFFSEELYDSLFKSPYDFTMGLYKEFNILNGDYTYWVDGKGPVYSQFSEDIDRFDEKIFDLNFKTFGMFRSFGWNIQQQGMRILNPPSVSGWKAYYQEPVYDFFWLNSVTIKAKKAISEGLSKWGVYVENGYNMRFSLSDFISSFEKPDDLNSFLEELTDRFLAGPIPDQAIERIRKSALGDELDESYWTEAVNQYISNSSKNNYITLKNRLEQFLFQIFELNEIHVH